MTEYVTKSFHDPLTLTLAGGAIAPSRECFMVGTLEGYIESIHEGGATPTDDLDDEVEGDVGALPRLRVEQLRAHVDIISSAVLRGVSHEGRLIGRGA